MEEEIKAARVLLYRFFKSFFLPQMEPEYLESGKKLISHLGPIDFEPFDQALVPLQDSLDPLSPEEAEKEAHFLFLDPFQGAHIPLEASHYLDGKAFGPSLARLRELLWRCRLAKDPEVREPEDHLALLMDFMESLIQEEKDLIFQRELFYNYLKPCAKGVIEGILAHESKLLFYPSLARFLEGFLALEEKLLSELP